MNQKKVKDMTRKKPVSSRKNKNVRKSYIKELEIQRDTKLDDAGQIETMRDIAKHKMSNEEGQRIARDLKKDMVNLEEEAQDLNDNINQIKEREKK